MVIIKIPSTGNGKEARIVNKRLCLSSLNSLHVTLTSNRNACLPVGRGFVTLTERLFPLNLKIIQEVSYGYS